MNQLASWYVEDIHTTDPVKLIVKADSNGLYIYRAGNDEVYIGIEVTDGDLRGTFGPEAEIIMADDVGTIVQEPAASSAEGSD